MIRFGIASCVLLASTTAHGQDDPFGLLGTAPHELAVPLSSADECVDCHGGFDYAPNDMWEGTLMANAVRDPLFQAALSIANQDIPEVGVFCLRCHTPSGFLEGRLEDGGHDGSRLIEMDHEGITCDLCHRMELPSDGPYIGNAQMVVADDYARRGTIGSDLAPHSVVLSDFLSSSELCGTCHEVSNPALGDFPIERTYSEWEASDFVTGESCQDCHMPNQSAYLVDTTGTPEAPLRQIHDHTFVGGNTWIPEVLAGMYPELGLGPAYDMVSEAAREILSESAEVMIELPSTARRDESLAFEVRVENLTGHKLPTGYPEGRRAWLEVTIVDPDGELVFESGAYDHDLGDLIADEQLRLYQAQLGHDGQLSYHMVEQDEVLLDTRIPPRGFRPDASMMPVGIEYETLEDGSLAHWDMAPYTVPLSRSQQGPLTVQVRMWYQTTTRAYVEFLQAENFTDDNGDILMDAWQRYGKDTPELIAEATATLEVADARPDDEDEEDGKKGCLCATSGVPVTGGVLIVSLLGLRRRR